MSNDVQSLVCKLVECEGTLRGLRELRKIKSIIAPPPKMIYVFCEQPMIFEIADTIHQAAVVLSGVEDNRDDG